MIYIIQGYCVLGSLGVVAIRYPTLCLAIGSLREADVCQDSERSCMQSRPDSQVPATTRQPCSYSAEPLDNDGVNCLAARQSCAWVVRRRRHLQVLPCRAAIDRAISGLGEGSDDAA
jgi:hypothetical protein